HQTAALTTSFSDSTFRDMGFRRKTITSPRRRKRRSGCTCVPRCRIRSRDLFPGGRGTAENHNRWMLSRRTFLGSAAACAVAAGAARPDDRLKLREFAYPQVTLTE